MSGKKAKSKRKQIFSKKTLAMCAGLCLSCAPVMSESEFLVSLFPHFTKPFGEAHNMQYGLGGGLKVTWRPIKNLNLFAEGDYLSMALPAVEPLSLFNASLGTGYHLDLSDRIALDFNLNVGAYTAKSARSMGGISAGGSIIFSYRLNPIISMDVAASGTHYAAGGSPLMMINTALSPGVTFNITELFNSTAKIDMQTEELAPVFPVLYSWYENNSFGIVTITNNEDYAITDVSVSFFQPQYMAHAKECAVIPKLKQGESAEVDLLAFFNEQMLELREKTDTNSVVIVNYSRLGQKRTKTFPLTVPVYGRNNMSWDDDRRAAVFVSSKDPAAMRFSKYVISLVRENQRLNVPINIQYALGIFEALNQFGINYVIDPSSAFEDNVGTSSIDFLQFPYQTLMYRGGDCDDLSILVCSLFEAVGVDTAFITIPGHIFMAFDSGLTEAQAGANLKSLSNYIVVDGEVWIPLEITLSDEGFYKAARVGVREWRTAAATNQAALYKMSDSWKIYQPISVPGATSYFNLPESDLVAEVFNDAIDEWSYGELRLTTLPTLAVIAEATEEPEEIETVITENPLSQDALKKIVDYAKSTVAIVPAAVREEELEARKEDDEEEDDGNDFFEDLLNDVFEPEAESVTETSQEPETESVAEIIPETPVAESIVEIKPEPVIEEESEPEPVYIAKLDSEPAVEPVQETKLEPVTESTPAPQPEPAETKKSPAYPVIALAAAATLSAAGGLIILAKKKKDEEEK